MEFDIEVISANNVALLESVFQIRKEVFVKEQGVDESEEYDEFETSSTHFIAKINGVNAGVCRYRNTDKGIKLERFAVLQSFRNKGVGERLLNTTLKNIDLKQYIYLHAQIQVVDFYERFGFEKVGEVFEEAGIKHFKMVRIK